MGCLHQSLKELAAKKINNNPQAYEQVWDSHCCFGPYDGHCLAWGQALCMMIPSLCALYIAFAFAECAAIDTVLACGLVQEDRGAPRRGAYVLR